MRPSSLRIANRDKVLQAVIEMQPTFGKLSKHFKDLAKEDRLTEPTLAKHLKQLAAEGYVRKEIISDEIRYLPTEKAKTVKEYRERTIVKMLEDLKREMKQDEDIFVLIGRHLAGNPRLTDRFLRCVSEFYHVMNSPEMGRLSQKYRNDERNLRRTLRESIEKTIPLKGKSHDLEEMISFFETYIQALKRAIIDDLGIEK